jgi:hypothetical protein
VVSRHLQATRARGPVETLRSNPRPSSREKASLLGRWGVRSGVSARSSAPMSTDDRSGVGGLSKGQQRGGERSLLKINQGPTKGCRNKRHMKQYKRKDIRNVSILTHEKGRFVSLLFGTVSSLKWTVNLWLPSNNLVSTSFGPQS